MTRILVVDDQKSVVDTCRRYLEHAGHEVVVAYNGEQAIDEVRVSSPGRPSGFVTVRGTGSRFEGGACD